MWRTIVVLLCCTYCLAQRAAVPDVSSSDVLPRQEADVPAEKAEDLWGEEKGEDYSYDDWSDFEEEAATRDEADSQEQEEAAKQVEEKQVSPVSFYANEEGDSENSRKGIEERVDPMQPWSSTPGPSLWGSNSNVAEEPSDVMGDVGDWSGKYLTSDELFDGEAGDYSSESKEDPEYPADLGEYEDIENWPGLDSEVEGEVEGDVEGDVDSDADSESDGKDVDSDEYIKPTPTPAVEEYGRVVEGRKRGVFTVWHYAIFAIAGAIFILGLLVIVGAAIRSVRQPTSDYRRLADPTKV